MCKELLLAQRNKQLSHASYTAAVPAPCLMSGMPPQHLLAQAPHQASWGAGGGARLQHAALVLQAQAGRQAVLAGRLQQHAPGLEPRRQRAQRGREPWRRGVQVCHECRAALGDCAALAARLAAEARLAHACALVRLWKPGQLQHQVCCMALHAVFYA